MYLNELGESSIVRQQQTRKKNGFYESVRWTLLLTRYSGMLPLKELSPADSHITRNKTILYALIYSLSLFVQFAKIVIFALEPLYKTYHVERFIIFVTYLNLLIVGVFMVPFCKNWAKVLSQVEDMESSLPSISQKNIKKMRKLVILVMFMGMADYFMFNTKHAMAAVVCSTNDDPLKTYLVRVTSAVFDVVPFNYFTAILLEVSRLQVRILWVFIDCLVINVSVYLNIRFEEFNRYLLEKEKELTYGNKRNLPWANVQQKYTKLMKLTMILEQFISHFVFFAFCNFLMIGRQFYFLINSHVTHEASCGNYGLNLYSLFKNVYATANLVTKMGLVAGYAAQVHTLSRKPLDALYTIPAYSYDRTFQRFVDQVYCSNISLSGFRCFYVTRQMILSMMASILTIEVMLLDTK